MIFGARTYLPALGALCYGVLKFILKYEDRIRHAWQGHPNETALNAALTALKVEAEVLKQLLNTYEKN